MLEDPLAAMQRAGGRGAWPGEQVRGCEAIQASKGGGHRPWRKGKSLRRIREGFDLVTVAQGRPFSLLPAVRSLSSVGWFPEQQVLVFTPEVRPTPS